MAKPKQSTKLEITYRDVTSIGLLPMNFKRHALEETRASIELRGVIDPIGYNPKTKNTFDGNGRTEVLKQMHADWLDNPKVEVPKGVEVDEHKWLVPTVSVSMTADEEVSAAAALNRIGELGGYDEAYMLEVLESLKSKDMLEATGYDDNYLSALLKRFPHPDNGNANPDDKNASDGLKTPGSGIQASGQVSNIKQVGLLFAPDKHKRFVELTINLSKPLKQDNTSDTILAALEYCSENLNAKAATDK